MLQADAPMHLPRRASCVAIDRDEWRLRRPQAGSDFIGILLGEVRERDGRIAEPVAGGKWISIRQSVFVQSISGNAEAVEIGHTGRKEGIVRRSSVNHARTQTEHGLAAGTDLIRKGEPGSERIGIVPVELAVTRRFIFHRAGQVAYKRIWAFEVGALHAAILLAKQSDKVVTQAVFQSQLASDFPTVLNVCRERMVAQPRIGNRRQIHRLRIAQQEAGIAEARSAIQGLAVFAWNAAL